MNIGERIKHIRKESGVTQKQLAEKLGMTQAAIVQFESEKSNPKIDTLKKIANALNVSVTDFLDDGESITEIGENGHIAHIGKYENLYDSSLQQFVALAAHFDGDKFTDEELEEIKQFAEFVKSKRKDNTDHLQVNAAHERTDIESTNEMRQQDEELMNDDKHRN